MKSIAGILPVIVLSLFMKKCGSDDLTSGVPIQGEEGTQVGQIAHDFTLPDRDGNPVSLSDFRGQVILVDISSMWCAPCKEEAAVAEELYQSYKPYGFITLSVLFENVDGRPPSASDLDTWAQTFGLTFPVLADRTGMVWTTYDDTGGMPLNIVIDRDFVIRYKQEGYSESTIKSQIEQYL